MARQSPRGTDAYGATHDYARTRRGLILQGERDRDLRAAGRFNADDRIVPVYVSHSLQFTRENIGGSGDASYLTRLATPTAATTWDSTAIDARMPWAGWVVGGMLWSNAARTGGTATLQVQITEGGVATDYRIPDCELNATYTQTAAGSCEPGIPFAALATLRAEIVAAGTWGPTTADMTAELIIVYETTLRFG